MIKKIDLKLAAAAFSNHFSDQHILSENARRDLACLNQALAESEQREYLERQLNDIGFFLPNQRAFKDDPRGREYGKYCASPMPDGTVNLTWLPANPNENGPSWICTFPTFADFETWARTHS